MMILVGVLLGGLISMNIACLRTASKMGERMTSVETKTDMLLHNRGFDVRKVDQAIKEHKEELKNNNRPSVGCIDPNTLYRDKEE